MPITVRSFHAASMYLRRFASAFGAGSVAMTLRPRARYSAAQLAPMTPVPTIATFRISLFFAISFSLDFFKSDQKLFEYLPTSTCLQILVWRLRPLPVLQVLRHGDSRLAGHPSARTRRSKPTARRRSSG